MSRTALLLAFTAALSAGSLHAEETTVYKTTGADGVNAYSQIESSGAQTQQVQGTDPELPAAEQAPKTETEKACDRARINLDLLSSDKSLQRDNDGDGTPEELTPEERASEKDLAERQVAAYCPAES